MKLALSIWQRGGLNKSTKEADPSAVAPAAVTIETVQSQDGNGQDKNNAKTR